MDRPLVGQGKGSGKDVKDVICPRPVIKFAGWALIGGRVGASVDTEAVVV